MKKLEVADKSKKSKIIRDAELAVLAKKEADTVLYLFVYRNLKVKELRTELEKR